MESRIQKLQDKIKELQDQQADLDSSIEDIYTTINDWKHPEHFTTPKTPLQTIINHPPQKTSTMSCSIYKKVNIQRHRLNLILGITLFI
jgi:hypothetical protein